MICRRVPWLTIPRRITEDPYVIGIQQIEMSIGEAFREIFSPFAVEVLLRDAIPMVAEFVHENVQQHVSSCLGVREPTVHFVLVPVVRHTQAQEYFGMGVEIPVVPGNPQILMPGVKINGAGFLPMKELMTAIGIAGGDENNSFQTLRQCGPLWDDVDKVLKIALADDMPVSPSG